MKKKVKKLKPIKIQRKIMEMHKIIVLTSIK